MLPDVENNGVSDYKFATEKEQKQNAFRVAFSTLILTVAPHHVHWKVAVDRFLCGRPIGVHFRLDTKTQQI